MSDTAGGRTTQAPHEVVECVARSIANDCLGPPPTTVHWHLHQGDARRVIQSLDAAGYVIVPKAAVAAALERQDAAI